MSNYKWFSILIIFYHGHQLNLYCWVCGCTQDVGKHKKGVNAAPGNDYTMTEHIVLLSFKGERNEESFPPTIFCTPQNKQQQQFISTTVDRQLKEFTRI